MWNPPKPPSYAREVYAAVGRADPAFAVLWVYDAGMPAVPRMVTIFDPDNAL